MDDICKKIREQIPGLIGEGLSPEKAVELEQHRSQCPGCNEYYQALEADDVLLREFTESIISNVTRLENITIDELRRRQLRGAFKGVSIGRSFLYKRVTQIAAVILIVAGILIVSVKHISSHEEPEKAFGQADEPKTVTTEPAVPAERDLDAIVEEESRELRRMIAASDIAGVLAILNGGQPQSRILAANYLAENGDERAINVLAQLAAEWKGEAVRNPFAAAIARIMIRLQEQEKSSEVGDEENIVAKETTTVKNEQDIGCKGMVVDEQGNPIANARIWLYYDRNQRGLGNRIIEETVSASDGSFHCRNRVEFSTVNELASNRDRYILLAMHQDHAFGWRNIARNTKEDEYRIILTAPTSTTIIVTDNENNPLPGVRVWPYSAGDSESGKAVFRDNLLLTTDVGLTDAVTDANGMALVKNLPDTKCSFHTTLKGYAEGVAFPGQTTIHLSRGADVSGWVLTERKEPVAGATLRFATNWMTKYFLVVTDDQGYFNLKDLPAKGWDRSPWGDSEGASGSYTVTLEHESCAAPEINLTLLPGQMMDDMIIGAYSETTLVECHVVEFDTDVPEAGVRVQGQNRIGRIDGYSDTAGIFNIRVLPGQVSLRFVSPPDGVYVMQDENLPESSLNFNATGEKMTVTLKTPPIAGFLRSVSGIVFGSDGITQSETMVYAGAGSFETSSSKSGRIEPVQVDGEGRFELKEVPAGRKLHLYAATKDRTLAATSVFEIPGDPDWSDYLAVNLAPTLSASVTINDGNGNIVPGMEFRIDPIVDGERIHDVDIQGRTDENGLLELDGIVPGLEYHLRGIASEMTAESSLIPGGKMLTLNKVLVPLEPQP